MVWSRAQQLAAQTPDSRNRHVDFLRAISIMVVVLGHWTLSAMYTESGHLQLANMLEIEPWTRWLTWAFQVMPVFFIVGGYSNAASWEAARRKGEAYGLWTATRLKRLIGPVVPLVLAWAAIGIIAHRAGVHPEMIRVGSQLALIPTWFLAVYVMVVVAAPGTHWAWRRFGMASFWAFVAGAVAIDTIAFSMDVGGLRWLNYAFIWLGVHHIGYVWKDGRIGGPGRALLWAAGGLAVLVFLIRYASYPISMITVPGAEVSNSRPPTLALMALGVFHGGLLLAIEAPVRRWLGRLGPWTATVLVNGTIMTLYLWHVTVLVLMVGLANLLGGIGLGLRPGSTAWWVTRPIWTAILLGVLAVFVGVFGRFEQVSRKGAGDALPGWRVAGGAVGVGFGLAVLALNGIGGDGMLGIRVEAVLAALIGAAMILGPGFGRTRQPPAANAT